MSGPSPPAHPQPWCHQKNGARRAHALTVTLWQFGLKVSENMINEWCERGWAVCYLVYQGSMAAPGVQALSTLTRRHAIKVVSTANVEDCCMAVGEVVGHECILSASRMNNAMVIFLNSIERVNELVEHGVVIGGEFVSVLPLSQPSKRVTLSNVPPFLSDDILTNALSRYGKIVSPIKKIPISSVSPLLKHIVSFRRFVYMIVQDDAELDLSLSFKVDGFEYVIFVTTAKTRCFGCGNFGHLIQNCPDKLNEKETIEGGNVEPAPSTSKVIEAGPVGSESPGLSRTETESVTGKGPVAASVAEVGSIAVNLECLRAADAELSVSESVDGVQVSGSSVKKQACDATENIVESMLQNVCELNGVDMEVEQNMFKVPQKKKKRGNSQDAKVLRKLDLQASDDQETESDSELSDSSVVLSQNDFSSRNYDVEDIKLFLKSTKNKRGVCVQEYFPDIKQFVEKTRNLMVEGCFTNKEMSEEGNAVLSGVLSSGELYKALQGMECGRAPGIDGLPVDFYKSFWAELGLDLLQVLSDSLFKGTMPLSCRRAIITLIPKKGDLTDIKSWRPVSLLCTDYKLLSKVLANRLSGVLDQEKAFDRVEHLYLWRTLEAFGFCQEFIGMVKVLYSEVESILKVNGGLCAPFQVERGIRQGLACVDPPFELLTRIQAVLVDFFWDKLHWVQQSVLYLPKEEGGQGLLQRADTEFSKSGILLIPPPKLRSDILEGMAEEIFRYATYPTDSQLDQAAEALINAHPCLREKGTRTGHEGWKHYLTIKTANFHSKLSKTGHPKITVNSLRNKHKGQNLKSISFGLVVLFGLVYALNLSYPQSLKFTFEFFQKPAICVPTHVSINVYYRFPFFPRSR
ncbi:putative 149 kDa protein [Labeo rohita]|uniref:149 kDa protein n=1 Tax=Labeo rohita TaxID=84645 RepID=A0ABQ8L5K0_LABRO|nr:putative 149 kDa protein [Labeo rohita]